MRKLLFLMIILVSLNSASLAQKQLKLLVVDKDWTINIGDVIQLGVGSNPDCSFKYVTAGKFLDAVKITKENGEQVNIKHDVDQSYNSGRHEVLKIYKDRTMVVKNGAAGRFTIEIDKAVKADELIPTPTAPTVNVVNQGSVADELAKLKKLYDDGVLTKKEYEAQKKKLLNQ